MIWKIKRKVPLVCYIEEQNGILLVEIKNTITSKDFAALSRAIDPYYEAHGEFKGIILHSKKFPYWKGAEARREYMYFVENYHYKFKKVAIGMGGFFPKLLPNLAKRFIKPELKNFGYNNVDAAHDWILL